MWTLLSRCSNAATMGVFLNGPDADKLPTYACYEAASKLLVSPRLYPSGSTQRALDPRSLKCWLIIRITNISITSIVIITSMRRWLSCGIGREGAVVWSHWAVLAVHGKQLRTATGSKNSRSRQHARRLYFELFCRCCLEVLTSCES